MEDKAVEDLLIEEDDGDIIDLDVDLESENAPVWYQEPETGWSLLHLAVHNEDIAKVRQLIEAGAIWNAVDNMGNTAGDLALSVNNQECYDIIRDAGLRSEMVLHLLQKGKRKPNSIDISGSGAASSTMVLRSEDSSAAGSSDAFLSSRLRFTKDEHGQELCLVRSGDGDEEIGVMMGWEKGIMQETVRLMVADIDLEDEEASLHVLNVGFGLGIIDTLFQSLYPARHVIIEAHPDVLAHMRDTGWYNKPGVEIWEGKWQDFVNRSDLRGNDGFDLIYTDTFGEYYQDLHQFFEEVPSLLRGLDSRFSFFNGLGATNALFYDIYTKMAAAHLLEMGILTGFTDFEVHSHTGTEVWGETRKYFSLPYCRIPICRAEPPPPESSTSQSDVQSGV